MLFVGKTGFLRAFFFFFFFLNALLSTGSMYSTISQYITKNISHASTSRNKGERKIKKQINIKNKIKDERVHKHQFTDRYPLYILTIP